MKLNKYLFSTFIAASTLLISSCSDFLDRSPQGQFTEDDNPMRWSTVKSTMSIP